MCGKHGTAIYVLTAVCNLYRLSVTGQSLTKPTNLYWNLATGKNSKLWV